RFECAYVHNRHADHHPAKPRRVQLLHQPEHRERALRLVAVYGAVDPQHRSVVAAVHEDQWDVDGPTARAAAHGNGAGRALAGFCLRRSDGILGLHFAPPEAAGPAASMRLMDVIVSSSPSSRSYRGAKPSARIRAMSSGPRRDARVPSMNASPVRAGCHENGGATRNHASATG